jgi:hypothetical protein
VKAREREREEEETAICVNTKKPKNGRNGDFGVRIFISKKPNPSRSFDV